MNSEDHQIEELHHNHEFSIIVNGRQKHVTGKEISFIQVVQLAFENATINENVAYTVTYKKGEKNKEGSMVNGDIVKLHDGMIFNVSATNQS
jgi:Multiubiquitin